MIMLTCFLFAAVSAKLRATTSMLVGTVFVVAALALFGATHAVWFAVLAMVVFSAGEMLASPKFSEFLGKDGPALRRCPFRPSRRTAIPVAGISASVSRSPRSVMPSHARRGISFG